MHVIAIPCSFDNYAYLLICPETRKAAIVDPAEYYPVSTVIAQEEVELEAVFCTHHHADHIGGLEDLLGEFPGVRVYGFGGDSARIPALDSMLSDGSELSFGRITGEVMHTPGHTSGSLCFLFGKHLFTGDTLFGAGCGRIFEGSYTEMYHCLNNRIAKLAPETRIYFGHEYTLQNLKFAVFVDPENPAVLDRRSQVTELREKGGLSCPSTLADELATNPFLRCDEPSILAQVGDHIPASSPKPLEVFTALRRLKDGF